MDQDCPGAAQSEAAAGEGPLTFHCFVAATWDSSALLH